MKNSITIKRLYDNISNESIARLPIKMFFWEEYQFHTRKRKCFVSYLHKTNEYLGTSKYKPIIIPFKISEYSKDNK